MQQCQFGERGRDTPVVARVAAEFVVAAATKFATPLVERQTFHALLISEAGLSSGLWP